jgi:hypothetical protein
MEPFAPLTRRSSWANAAQYLVEQAKASAGAAAECGGLRGNLRHNRKRERENEEFGIPHNPIT